MSSKVSFKWQVIHNIVASKRKRNVSFPDDTITIVHQYYWFSRLNICFKTFGGWNVFIMKYNFRPPFQRSTFWRIDYLYKNLKDTNVVCWNKQVIFDVCCSYIRNFSAFSVKWYSLVFVVRCKWRVKLHPVIIPFHSRVKVWY